MRTKYGEVSEELVSNYYDRLVNRVFKLLPLKEEENPTIAVYLESIMLELVGGKELSDDFKNNADFLSLIMTLEGLSQITNMITYKREIFKCINIVRKLQSISVGN
jgi:hypothetical protein